ncbi:hypothetical protein EV643_120139 [Kribbella sp. VKM Ac-2527]|uniref:Uncharacterized protein n=1 Tax=Kribbella caucasensis TaxID=2512215 RepID=A0A4R6JKW6_9ACTN|nr:hypothetical protein EV643_120139 [Kribbella sp. VKM Ac-2527]
MHRWTTTSCPWTLPSGCRSDTRQGLEPRRSQPLTALQLLPVAVPISPVPILAIAAIAFVPFPAIPLFPVAAVPVLPVPPIPIFASPPIPVVPVPIAPEKAHFTPPAVRPATMRRWKSSTAITSGMVTMTPAAIWLPNG